jgi:hypothetical protein
MRRTLLLTVLLFSAGCGIGNTTGGISWKAKLDSMPSPDCVRGAIAEAGGMTLVDYKRVEKFTIVPPRKPVGMDNYYIDIAELQFSSNVDMAVMVGRYYQHQDFSFSLGHSASERYRAGYEAAARRLIAKISTRCGVPELEQRVREQEWREWEPYMFNV